MRQPMLIKKVSEWMSYVWCKLRPNYTDDHIFNFDGIRLYKRTPDVTLKFKCEKCIGSKQSKLRPTVFVRANKSSKSYLFIGKEEIQL